MRTRPCRPKVTASFVLAVALVSFLAGCGVSDSQAETATTMPSSTTAQATTTTAPPPPTTTAPTTTTTPPTTNPPTTAAEPAAAPTGPQICGMVTTTIGTRVTVEVIRGDVDCAFAEDLLDTYYNAPPTPPEGSGAYVSIGEWECNSSSTQSPGRASTCRTEADGEIISRD